MNTRVYIGLGSNMGPSADTIAAAVESLAGLSADGRVEVSPLYRTAPVGGPPQADFLNAVAAFDTALPAHDLLSRLQAIERHHGRRADGEKWGPRPLDLDILLYGDAVIKTETLTIPHARMRERRFVLLPLADLRPRLRIPGHNQPHVSVAECLRECEPSRVKQVARTARIHRH